MPGIKTAGSGSNQQQQQRAMQLEKREMDAAVARVRDVIKNVSNNDIVLALHTNDCDVERTIHALAEHGRAVLDSWESTTSGRAGRNKRNRNAAKAKQPDTNNGAAAAATGNGEVKPQQQQQVAASSSKAHQPTAHLHSNGIAPPQQNGYTIPLNAAPLPPRQSSAPQQQQQPQRPAAASSSSNHNNQHNGTNKPPPHSQQRQSHASESHSDLMSTDPAVKKKAIAKEVKNLSKHDAVVQHAQARFNEEIKKANDRMRRAFQELRELLNARESYLQEELSTCQQEGTRVLSERALLARQLHMRSERVQVMSDAELNELRTDIKNFVHDRKYEEDLGSSLRFIYEPDHAHETLKSFGRVVPVKPLVHGQANGNKHSSHSSLVSSVGEDSGLGMISPVSPQEAKKPMSTVECGGVVMRSDSLSAEQLEQLNQRLRESLATSGLSTDMFTGGSQPVTRRRGPPNPARSNKAGRGGKKEQQPNGPAAPALSILE